MPMRRLLFPVLFLLVMPAGAQDLPSSFDWQGHRGARGLLPENTIPAMLRALELGMTTLEMDVVITQDEQVVLSHEPWFSAAICSLPDGTPVPEDEDRAHRLYAMPYAEAARYDCGRRGNPRFPEQQPMAVHKPLLRHVIAAAEGFAALYGLPPVRYNIETKSQPEGDGVFHPDPETFTRLLYDVLAQTGVKDRATIQSFDVRTLQAARQLDPSWATVLLIGRAEDRGLAANLDTLGFVPEVYSPDYRLVDAALVEAVHARGMQFIPWTVNEPEAMQHLIDLGVDGIITDYPDRARAFMDAE